MKQHITNTFRIIAAFGLTFFVSSSFAAPTARQANFLKLYPEAHIGAPEIPEVEKPIFTPGVLLVGFRDHVAFGDAHRSVQKLGLRIASAALYTKILRTLRVEVPVGQEESFRKHFQQLRSVAHAELEFPVTIFQD